MSQRVNTQLIRKFGFSFRGAIIAGIIVVILAALCLAVYHHYTKPGSADASITSTVSAASTTTTMIKMPQLGISIIVPNAIKDLTYSSLNVENGSVGVSTQSLTNMASSCAANGTAPPLGKFYRRAGQYPKNATPANTPGKLVKQFSSYYLAWAAPQSSCSSHDAMTQRLDLENSFNTIQQISD